MKLIRHGLLAALAAVLLTACTPGVEPTGPVVPATGPSVVESPDPVAGPVTADVGTADAALPVMAQVSVAAGASRTVPSAGGVLTALLRSVAVSGEVLTLKFAIQWDAPEADDTEVATGDELGLGFDALMAVDGESLTGYRPFCSQGSRSGDAAAVTACNASPMVSPDWAFSYPNHGLVEGYAVLPAPEGHPAAVDVTLGAPFPIFTDATVTYR